MFSTPTDEQIRQIRVEYAAYVAAMLTLAGSYQTVSARKAAIAVRDEFEAGIQGHVGTLLDKCVALAHLLIECRDALPAINAASARLHHVRLDLADRIDSALEPWAMRE